ncbi:hypothetical protein F5884DRAFT_445337 [Xylogone sp. PMI_703]|nr:hypothetical protein F5884DRAFT_445337 [Xylogone sp. PMI_703]
MLIKILLTTKLSHGSQVLTEDQMGLIVPSHLASSKPKRRLSLAIMQDEMLLIPQKLVEIQERRCQRLTFAQLPLIYYPNSTIYTVNNDQLQAFIISGLSGMEQKSPNVYEPLHISAWSIGHDGKRLTKVYHTFLIPQFRGEKAVTNLKHIPSGYLEDEAEHRKKLVTRGRKYCELAIGFHYKQVLQNMEPARVIVDQEEAPSEIRGMYKFDGEFEITSHQDLKPRVLMACPPTISAYVLEEGKWTNVLVDEVTDIESKQNLVDNLVRGEEKDEKEIAETLVRSHLYKMDMNQYDTGIPFQQGLKPKRQSRKGLVVLLRGNSGVGKTFMTKCLAETVQRPLILDTIGFGDGDAERRLSEMLQLAEKWRAILVVKDSGGSLSARSVGDSNTAVTTAMGVMNAYLGVLFITANSGIISDEAFYSRIDFIINYKPLELSSRVAIWDYFIDKAVQEDLYIDRYDIGSYVRSSEFYSDRSLYNFVNGHDIRNIMLAAQQLAQQRNQTMSGEHIHLIMQSRAEIFKERGYRGISEMKKIGAGERRENGGREGWWERGDVGEERGRREREDRAAIFI